MIGISKNFLKAEPGVKVFSEGRGYLITHVLSVNRILATDLETNEAKHLTVDSLKFSDEKASVASSATGDITQFSGAEWAEAQRRFMAIKPLLENPMRTRSQAESIASDAGVHVATLYKWLKQFQAAGHVSVLVPSKRGRKQGTTFLDKYQENVISAVIEEFYLKDKRPGPSEVIEKVASLCRLAKIVPPHPNTVRNRLAALNPATVLRRRGQSEKARDKYEAIQGKYPDGNFPLEAVQIDHTPTNVILVDETYRKPIGRAWLTLAIDTFSRMIVGLFISFERPDAAAVGICIARGMCPKREYLAKLDVPGDWDVWGVPSSIYADNAKEFHSEAVERGASEYNIDLQWRPVATPHYGGHIERMMGNVGKHDKKLPGATFSKPEQRKGYDSEKEAVLTVREYEQQLVDFIANIYHERRHSALGMSPKAKWELGVLGGKDDLGTGILPIPEDPIRVEIDFMPVWDRTVQRYGIQIDNIFYYHRVLDPYINAADPDTPTRKRMFLVRRHPADISKIYFLDPADNRYLEIPYANITHPPMTIWELRHVQQHLKKMGEKDINEDKIFAALERIRERNEKAAEKSKTARRQQARNPSSAARPETAAVPRQSSPPAPKSATAKSSGSAPDPFDVDITPFE